MVPAIAVPVEQKTQRNFELPVAHRRILPAAIREATAVLIVGWRASEQHFNELFKNHVLGLALQIRIVCGPGGAETKRNLEALGFCDVTDEEVGFRDFLEEGRLERYLASISP